jgi:hypothetical protein
VPVDFAVEKLLYQSVQTARSQGHSWAAIGETMGISRQAAWERFADGLMGETRLQTTDFSRGRRVRASRPDVRARTLPLHRG